MTTASRGTQLGSWASRSIVRCRNTPPFDIAPIDQWSPPQPVVRLAIAFGTSDDYPHEGWVFHVSHRYRHSIADEFCWHPSPLEDPLSLLPCRASVFLDLDRSGEELAHSPYRQNGVLRTWVEHSCTCTDTGVRGDLICAREKSR